KVIICGAGQVGFGIAERLAAEGNDISIVDTRPDLVQRANDTLDVRAYVGNGAHPDVLEKAGASASDMLIAVTLHDEVNMVACQVANALFDIPTTIARIRAQTYRHERWGRLFSKERMGIGQIISPELEVGDTVLRRLELPGAFDSAAFADNLVTAIGISCGADCPIVDTPIRQLAELFPDLPAVIVGIIRKDQLIVPHGDDQISVGDDVYVIAQTDSVGRVLKIFGHEEQRSRRVVIAGGGNIGLYVARQIEARGLNLKLKIIEASKARAVEIAEQLERTVVLHGSALSEELMREAEVGSADTIVTLTNDDQVNVLASALARQLGCGRSLTLINNQAYSGMARAFGIDAQINPRAITISRVLGQVRRGRIQQVHSVHNGAGEIIEAEALDTAQAIGKPLKDIGISDGLRIGALIRKGRVLAPRGQTRLEAKDRVVLFARSSHVREVEQLFRVSIEYF
ncbi:MAG TPA: Trk system potassium transporter TrkA, partial [Hyphomicrobiaceae bacterium]|nr:Trk system potassium transporter TrkA [Hyphomicrobiaceae bacterium]